MTVTTVPGVMLNDGYITGTVMPGKGSCPRCKAASQRCIKISGVVLPAGITIKATILQARDQEEPTCIERIGLTCGCYARFHRQVAIIRERTRE